ncbi:hypothetical protein EYC59_00365 [Candidatus Saccharibacteria bacterium]|nr:MAG: hypothetical protein EYC59_00365 [Candidatus Saccharibacteria bacterium]
MNIITLLAQIDASPLPKPAANQAAISTLLQIVFAIAGSIALLIIVIGGLRYILAHGDPSAVSQAKKAILYAVIGLLVCMAAYSIVTFVIKGVIA